MPNRNISRSCAPVYRSLSVRAPDRLAKLRAAYDARMREARGLSIDNPYVPKSWRDMRYGTLADMSEQLGQGYDLVGTERVPVWHTFGEGHFRQEGYADECDDAPRDVRGRHGWYSVPNGGRGDDVYRGIIGYIGHGRWLAGYEDSGGGGRTWYTDTHDSAADACAMADEHARVSAERQSEYVERQNTADDLRVDIDDELMQLCVALAARNHPRAGERAREQARDLLASIRGKRDRLAALVKDGAE